MAAEPEQARHKPPSASMDLLEKNTFVRNNPLYGYTSPAAAGTASSAAAATATTGTACRDQPMIDEIRERDFPSLLQPLADATETSPVREQQEGEQQQQQQQQHLSKLVYLDHAGATLFGTSQLREAMKPLLAGDIHGNPHSQGPVSSATAAHIDRARHAVLQHFGASPREWSVVFTSGATAALKMVGEQFPWRRRRRQQGRVASRFVHARRSHNSVLGIREYAREGGADVQCLDLDLGLDGVGSRGCCLGSCSWLGSDEEGQGWARAKPEDAEDDAEGPLASERRCSCCHCCNSSDGDCAENPLGGRQDVSASAGTSCRCSDNDGDDDDDGGGDNSDGKDGDEDGDDDNGADDRGVIHSLFAFPAECNATGLRPDLGIAGRVKRGALSGRRPCCRPRRYRRCGHDRCCASYNNVGGTHLRRCVGNSRNRCESERGGPARIDSPSQGKNFNTDEGEGGKGAGGPSVVGGRRRRRRRRRPEEQWWVLLDAAKYVGTASLDLAKVEADFVALSFYKIFGYPTGIGALLVREPAARVLGKVYFGGGTVAAALADSPFRQLRSETERRLTDGTEDFLGILALEAGFGALKRVGGMEAIAAHTSSLARYLHTRLLSLRHGTGEPVIRFFGGWEGQEEGEEEEEEGLGSVSRHRSKSAATVAQEIAAAGAGGAENKSTKEGAREKRRGEKATPRRNRGKSSVFVGQGPVLTMGFLRPGRAEKHVGHAEVEKIAGLENIQLRTGCFCNPGACQAALDLTDDDVKEHLERGHVCWDEHDLIDGRPTGLVRVSLGWMSTWEDAAAFVSFVLKHFVVEAELQTGPACLPQTQEFDEEIAPPHDAEGAHSPNTASADEIPRPKRTLESIYVYPIKSCAPQRAGTPTPSRIIFSSPPDLISPSSGTANGYAGSANGSNGGGGTGGGENEGYEVASEGLARAGWPLGPSGLAYDREWAVVDHRDRALRLKQVPGMCHIRPSVDLAAGTLTVAAPEMLDLVLPLDYWGRASDLGDARGDGGGVCRSRSSPRDDGVGKGGRDVKGGGGGGGGGSSGDGDAPMIVRVCGNRREGVTCTASASAWFTRFLGVPCSLVRAVAAVEATAAAFAAAADDDDADAVSDAITRGRTNGGTAAPVADGGPVVVGYRNGNGSGNDVAYPGTSPSDEGGTSMRTMPWFRAGVGLGVRRRASSSSPAAAAAAGTAGDGDVATSSRAFANEAPYLLISRASVAKANDMIRRESGSIGGVEKVTESVGPGDGARTGGEGGANDEQVTAAHFRPNFVINGSRAHEEDEWRSVRIGGILRFSVIGPCSRCSMINIDPETGDASGVALKVLAGYRRERANILFGQFLALDPDNERLLPTAQPPSFAESGNAPDAKGRNSRDGETPPPTTSTGGGGGGDCKATSGGGCRRGDGYGGDIIGGSGEEQPAATAAVAAAAAAAVEGETEAGRVGAGSDEVVKKAKETGWAVDLPAVEAVGGWKFWVWEGMEVVGEM